MEAIELDPTDAPLADLDETEDSTEELSEEEIQVKADANRLCSCQQPTCVCPNKPRLIGGKHLDNFDERFSDSIEDLVNCFDQKISNCFKPHNYTRKTEDIAPVQVRSEEEIMEECQMWWTLTGNYGSILPLPTDWSKSSCQKLERRTLNFTPRQTDSNDNSVVGESSDEDKQNGFDFNFFTPRSIGGGHINDFAPTADQVIDEIDEMMQDSSLSEITGSSDITGDSSDSMYSPTRPSNYQSRITSNNIDNRKESPLDRELEFRQYKLAKLSSLRVELESLIQVYNETLVQELALRDELEFEKETKNAFISLLLGVQNKRRQYHLDQKRKGAKALFGPTGQLPQYLTTVIPYHKDKPLDMATISILVKVLKAVHDDTIQSTPLLTEYILNVLCQPDTARS